MAEKGMLYNIQRMSVQDGPGIRTTVFFKGCPLRCRWCGNPESQSIRPQLMIFDDVCLGCGRCEQVCPNNAVIRGEHGKFRIHPDRCAGEGRCVERCPAKARVTSGKEYTVEEIMRVVRKDAAFYHASGGGVTFGGGECTMQSAFLTRLMAACREEGLHTCVDTCGCVAAESFNGIIPLTDLFLFDVKHMDPEAHKRLTGADNALILRNLKAALSADVCLVRIRMPLMRGLNDSDENLAAMAAFLGNFGRNSVEVIPCHAFGRNKYAALGRPVPGLPEYTNEELQTVLKRFANHGLIPIII